MSERYIFSSCILVGLLLLAALLSGCDLGIETLPDTPDAPVEQAMQTPEAETLEPMPATTAVPSATAELVEEIVEEVEPSPSPEPTMGMANPAAVYCEEQGFTYEIRTASDGSQFGICILADGTECDGWAYFNGTCQPPQDSESSEPAVSEPTAEPPATDSQEADADEWVRYTNTVLGYTLMHPADVLVEETRAGTAVSFTGPLEADEHWPMMWVSSPNTTFYRPPEGADAREWLIEQNLPGSAVTLERQIGGLPAYHTSRPRSPQSYGSDEYYILRGRQLFHIGLLHTGDRQDWAYYNRFLDSISFDMSGAAGPSGTPQVAETVDGWAGTVRQNPWGSQIDDYFEREDGEQFGIHVYDNPALAEELDRYRWQGNTIQVWGDLLMEVPDAGNRQIRVTRLEALSGPSRDARNLSVFATATASSELPADRFGTYHAWSAVDGQPKQPWSEGAAGPGVGEWLQLDFPAPVEVWSISLVNGFDYSDDIFAANNRIKRATLVFSDGEQIPLEIADSPDLQTISLARAPGPNIETTSVRVIIDEVYPGTRFDDTCLGEIEVWGIVR